MRCFGVSNHSPETVLDFLVSKGSIDAASAVSVVPVGKRLLEKPPKRKVLFIVQIADLFRNLAVLNGANYTNAEVFVFASPLRINELTGCTPLDTTPSAASKGVGFNLLHSLQLAKYRAAQKKPPCPTARATTKYLIILTDNVKHGSLLTPLMTFIYTLPKSTHQTPVKEAVARYFYGSSLTSVESFLATLLSENNLTKIRDILTSEIAESYRAAMKSIKTGECTLPSACTKFSVSDYEIKYLQSIVISMKGRKHLRGKSLLTIQKSGLRPSSALTKKAGA